MPLPSGAVWRAVLPALGKSLVQMAAILAASWMVSRLLGPVVGSLAMLGGSFLMLARTFRQESRLNVFSCFLPPACAAGGYALQTAMVGRAGVEQPAAFILPVMAAGAAIGYLSGRTHVVAARGRVVVATRTSAYLAVWVVSVAVTQLFAMAGQYGFLSYSLLGGAFSTAMLLIVALVLFGKRSRALAGATTALLVWGALAVRPVTVGAQGNVFFPVADMQQVCDLVHRVPQLMKHASSPYREGAGVACTFSSTKGPGRYIVTIHLRSSPQVAHDTFFSPDAGGFDRRDIDLGDEAFDTSSRSYPWIRYVRLGRFVVSAGAESPVIETANTVVLETLARIEASGDAIPPLPGGGSGRELPPGPFQGAWWAPLLPQGATAFPDDFGADPVIEATVGGTAAAAMVLILTCIGLTVAQAVPIVAAQMAPLPPKGFTDTSDLIDPFHDTPLHTDGHGQYWDAAKEKWVGRREAERIIAELTAQKAGKAQEDVVRRGVHDRQADVDWKDQGRRTRREALDAVRVGITRVSGPALIHDDDTSEFFGTAEAFAREQKKDGDYAAGTAGVVAAVDGYKKQEARLKGLDKMLDAAKGDMARLRDAEAYARRSGNPDQADYLRGQREIALENLRRINDARVNAAERMSRAGDRILARGGLAAIEVGGRLGADALTVASIPKVAKGLSGPSVGSKPRLPDPSESSGTGASQRPPASPGPAVSGTSSTLSADRITVRSPRSSSGPSWKAERLAPSDEAMGSRVRTMLREEGVREDLVNRMGYHPGPAGGSRMGSARMVRGERGWGQVMKPGLRNRTSTASSAAHELGHVQQGDQNLTQAARGGPRERWYGRDGTLSPYGRKQAEIEIRHAEIDRNLRVKQRAIERAGANPIDPRTWPDEAAHAQKEIEDAVRELAKLNKPD